LEYSPLPAVKKSANRFAAGLPIARRVNGVFPNRRTPPFPKSGSEKPFHIVMHSSLCCARVWRGMQHNEAESGETQFRAILTK